MLCLAMILAALPAGAHGATAGGVLGVSAVVEASCTATAAPSRDVARRLDLRCTSPTPSAVAVTTRAPDPRAISNMPEAGPRLVITY